MHGGTWSDFQQQRALSRRSATSKAIEPSIVFDRPRATYDSDTGLLRDPNALAIVGYITLKGTFVGSSRIAEELFAEPGSVLLRERRDNDLAFPDAEAPAEIIQRAGLNEEYDASSVDELRSKFRTFCFSPPRET